MRHVSLSIECVLSLFWYSISLFKTNGTICFTQWQSIIIIYKNKSKIQQALIARTSTCTLSWLLGIQLMHDAHTKSFWVKHIESYGTERACVYVWSELYLYWKFQRLTVDCVSFSCARLLVFISSVFFLSIFCSSGFHFSPFILRYWRFDKDESIKLNSSLAILGRAFC